MASIMSSSILTQMSRRMKLKVPASKSAEEAPPLVSRNALSMIFISAGAHEPLFHAGYGTPRCQLGALYAAASTR